MTDDDSSHATLSIGAVSRATGIPASTLRTWERRYGFPDPARSEAGHRRYVPEVVERLKMIERALDQGCRPSDVVDLSRTELENILDEPDDAAPNGADFAEIAVSEHEDSSEVAASIDDAHSWLDTWMTAVRSLDGNALRAHLRTHWNRMGGLKFLEQRVGPFLVRIGHAWRSGNLEIAHEHHVSEQLQDFLSARWRPLSERASGPVGVCATLPGENHAIGLHIAALVMTMANWRVVFLGSRTPPEDVAAAADMEDVRAVTISFSSNFDPHSAQRASRTLREDLDDGVDLVVGGGGAPDIEPLLPGTLSFETLQQFYDWAFDEANANTADDS
jgi:DNA-binding transcriptional MerR regulator/methylmalonyl-CoA mutase cobalamin-binding subunit